MRPTATEKLILQMLCDVHKHLEIDDSYDADLISKAIASEDYWVLNWAYEIRDPGDETPAHVKLVVDALDMYSFLRDSFDEIGPEGRQVVEAAVQNAAAKIEFPGFDGNNETEYRTAARFLVDDLQRFQTMKEVADRNSHSPQAPVYARMFEIFDPIRTTLVGHLLSPEEIIEVLQARVHPENR
ncbi:MAG: hypothetical protein EOP09_02835 [Proteobacteria bacterium]|nr:MAG: hypothetical protein EOP09_02835 [Pseudomonadota bacterium]